MLFVLILFGKFVGKCVDIYLIDVYFDWNCKVVILNFVIVIGVDFGFGDFFLCVGFFLCFLFGGLGKVVFGYGLVFGYDLVIGVLVGD